MTGHGSVVHCPCSANTRLDKPGQARFARRRDLDAAISLGEW